MEFSEYMKKGITLSDPAIGTYIVHSGRGHRPRACAIGAAVIGKFGVNAHCVSHSEVKKMFPNVPGTLLLEIANRNDRTFKGEQMSREDIANWLSKKGY